MQPPMPAQHGRVDFPNKIGHGLLGMDSANNSGKEWRLRDAGGRDARRAGAIFNLPEFGIRKIVGGNGMVDDRRHHAILPLPTQERANLQLGARQIKVGEAERDQSRIPVPLVRILVRSRFDKDTCIVASQNRDCTIDQRSCAHMFAVKLVFVQIINLETETTSGHYRDQPNESFRRGNAATHPFQV